MNLLPKDRALYGMLDEMAGLLAQAAGNLADSMDGPRREPALDALRSAERRADDLAIRINVHADQSVVPPIDREDVRALTHSIDAVVDQAEDVAETVKSHQIYEVDEPAQRVVRLLERAGTRISEAVQELEAPRHVLEHTQEIRTVREEADAVLAGATARLFEDGADPLDVVKRMSLYQSLERAVALCAEAADAIERVAVKER